VVGGPGLVASLINAGLLDELRLIVHPVAAGDGSSLFGGIAKPQPLEFASAERMGVGRVHLTYAFAPAALGANSSPTRFWPPISGTEIGEAPRGLGGDLCLRCGPWTTTTTPPTRRSC
jgi:hypothetical protein